MAEQKICDGTWSQKSCWGGELACSGAEEQWERRRGRCGGGRGDSEEGGAERSKKMESRGVEGGELWLRKMYRGSVERLSALQLQPGGLALLLEFVL